MTSDAIYNTKRRREVFGITDSVFMTLPPDFTAKIKKEKSISVKTERFVYVSDGYDSE